MSKLSLDALKQRAEAVASEDLLATISGGTENACHDATQAAKDKYGPNTIVLDDGTIITSPRDF